MNTAMALILIVDDSPTEVHVMQKALERHGYKTAAAAWLARWFRTSSSWTSSCPA
jgi:CheY-like chemotaxis protein